MPEALKATRRAGTFPWSIGMAFTHPAAILANEAFHGLANLHGLLPRIFLTSDSALPWFDPAVWSGPTCVVRKSSRVGPFPEVTLRIAPRPRPYETGIAAVSVNLVAASSGRLTEGKGRDNEQVACHI
jgi:hypothetical protein